MYCTKLLYLIQILFVGEGAVDTGGPQREFFRLLAEQVRESLYFQNGEDSAGSFFACNTSGYRVWLCVLNVFGSNMDL